jgi:hypothetical protein
MSDAGRRERAEARRARAILRKSRLGPLEADLSPIRGVEALSLVHQLTMESWALSRREEPQYTREQIPWRFVPGRLT